MKETYRDQRGWRWLDDARMDVRDAARALRRSPRASPVVSVLTLALGIGATTAVFSVVNGVLLKPLPYPSAESLVRLMHRAFRPRRSPPECRCAGVIGLSADAVSRGYLDRRRRTLSYDGIRRDGTRGAERTMKRPHSLKRAGIT